MRDGIQKKNIEEKMYERRKVEKNIEEKIYKRQNLEKIQR